MSGSATWKEKNISISVPVLPPEICNMIFDFLFFCKSWIPHIFIKLSRWMKTMKGLTFLCYKNELGHKQLLLIVFGIRNNRLPIYPFCPSILSDSWLQKWREHFLARFINPVRSRYKNICHFHSNVLHLNALKNGFKTSKDNSFKSSFTKPIFLIQTFAPSQLHLNFINESTHRQMVCRGVLSYSEIYVGKGSLWFGLFFILLPFLLCPATKSRAAYK